MATKLKDKYGTLYARGMKVDYYPLYGTNMLEHLGIEMKRPYYIRCIRKSIAQDGMLLLELFTEPEFVNFIGTFHSSWFREPEWNTVAGQVLYDKA